jgi:uncharacterized protein YndB with AHSA1/START domain
MNDLPPLPHRLDRTLVIRAPRALVFRYFTDSARFAQWWGAGSTIAAHVGGDVVIRYPNRIVGRGKVTALEPDRRIVFTYGYENSHPELPPGRSLVTIELADVEDGTRLTFRHDFASAALRDLHVAGWRYHLAVFANVVANEHHAGAAARVEQWFDAWAEADPARRRALLAACTTDTVTMHDSYACCGGRDELDAHIANCHVHVPGVRMRAAGAPRHCQGTLHVAWDATDAAGKACGGGTHVMSLAGDGRIRAVVGFL